MQLEKFLSYFWKPVVEFLKEWDKAVKIKIDTEKYYPHESMLEMNKTDPVGLFFTPNWEYPQYTIGQSKLWVRKSENTKQKYNAIYVDFDYRHSSQKNKDLFTREQYRNLIVEQWFSIIKIKPTFVVETKNWFHVYRLLDESARRKIEWASYRTLNRYFWEIMWDIWADTDSAAINKLMRVPWAIQRKYNDPFVTKLWFVDAKYNLTEEEQPFIEYLTESDIDKSVNRIKKNSKEYAVVKKEFSSRNDWYYSAKLDDITIPILFESLSKSKVYTWPKYELHGSGIYIDWVKTDGYKYHRWKDFVHCFSMWFHDIDERPRGNAISFMYHLFKKDWSIVDEFVKESFWFSIYKIFDNVNVEDINETKISWAAKTVIFSDLWVFLEWEINSWKKTDHYKSAVINQPIQFLGRWLSKISKMRSEQDDERNLFLFKRWDKTFEIETCFSEMDFNKKYQKKNITFVWWDIAVKHVFEILSSSEDVRQLNIISDSWHHWHCIVIGWKVVQWYLNENDYIIADTEPPDDINKKEIDIYELFKKISVCFGEKITALVMLSTISVYGMNIRSDGWMIVFPAMFIWWRTKSWKSTLAKIMKHMIWFSDRYRRYAINSITPQPLSVASTSNALLHLEEFTNIQNPQIENLLRNIINRDKSSRWMTDGNIHFNHKSPLLLLWESLPTADSLQNRLMLVRLDWKHDASNVNLIYELEQYTCAEFIKSFYEAVDKKELVDWYFEWVVKMRQAWMDWRWCEVYWFLYTINKQMWLIDQDLLIDYSIENYNSMNMNNVQWDTIDYFVATLSQAHMSKAATVLSDTDDDWEVTDVEIIFQQKFYIEHKAEINEFSWLLQSKWYGNYMMNGLKIRFTNELRSWPLNKVYGCLRRIFKV